MTPYIPLSSAALSELPEDLSPDPYDRSAGSHVIAHLGVGAFHRAHQAAHLDDLHQAGDESWREIGIGLLEGDRAIRDAMAVQDCLYTLTLVAPDGADETRVISSISEYLFLPDGPEAVIERLAAPEVRIVSLTITEGGYEVDDTRTAFTPRSADVQSDLRRTESDPPRSALGVLEAALSRRFNHGIPPFTVMSCDNIPGNGEVCRTALVGFAHARGSEHADRIARDVSFPSSMVDRITPRTTEAVRSQLKERWGIDDLVPVRAESFQQWVIEDRFPQGRPAWERVGAQLVDDVTPYEQMKLRMLNASHQVMSHIGLLVGHRFVHEAMADPDVRALVHGYLESEAVPTVPPVPGVDLAEYTDELLARFSSTAVADTLERQIVDASDRIPGFVLPVIRDQRAAGASYERAALAVAAWAEHTARVAATDGLSAINDPRAVELARLLSEGQPLDALVDLRDVFGDLSDDERFRSSIADARTMLRHLGPRRALQNTLEACAHPHRAQESQEDPR